MSLNQNLNRECTLSMDRHELDADECKIWMMLMRECNALCHPPSHLNNCCTEALISELITTI